ncbi:MAG: hypothetical protein MR210_09645 [Erysipelotrichaceae bacterium]|nr:hypothetical protein [Erysipelotrichaceae bacterium]MDY5251533.1 hypothetical protein [Erysipelotrichaceae bacterium]
MNWQYFILGTIGCFIIYFVYGYFSKRHYFQLLSLFYRENKVDEFLDKLNSFPSKIFFTYKIRQLMRIDAYLAKKDYEALNEIFDYLNRVGLRLGDRYTVLQKEVIAYADNGQNEAAIKALKQMEEMLPKFKKDVEHYRSMYDESKYIVAIKVEKDGQYAEDLVKIAREAKMEVVKGMYFFKASQSYYLRGDMKMCKNRLQDAYDNLKDTTYGAQIKKIMDENDLAKIMDIAI